MANKLTPEEEQELAQLEAELAQSDELTPEEERELAQLEAEEALKELEAQGITPSTPPSAPSFSSVGNNLDALNKLNTEGPLGSKANMGRVASLVGAPEASGTSIANTVLEAPQRFIGEALNVPSDVIENVSKLDPLGYKKQLGQALDMFMVGNVDIATLGMSKLAGLATRELNTADKFVKKFGQKVLNIKAGDLAVNAQKSTHTNVKSISSALKDMYKYKNEYFNPTVKTAEDLSDRVLRVGLKADELIQTTANSMEGVLDSSKLTEDVISKIPEIRDIKDPLQKFDRIVDSLNATMKDQAPFIIDSLVNKTPVSGDVLYNALKKASMASKSIDGKVTEIDVKIARQVANSLKDIFRSKIPEFDKLHDLKNISASFEEHNVFKPLITKASKAKDLKGNVFNVVDMVKSNVNAVKEMVKPTNISKEAGKLTQSINNTIPQAIQKGAMTTFGVSKGLSGSSAAWERYNATKQQNNK